MKVCEKLVGKMAIDINWNEKKSTYLIYFFHLLFNFISSNSFQYKYILRILFGKFVKNKKFIKYKIYKNRR